MSATTVRDALLTQLQADTALVSEFTAPQIKKGVELNFDIKAATKGLRLAITASDQELVDMLSKRVNASYAYLVLAYFYETNPENVDDRMNLYDEIIREGVEKILDIGIEGARVSIGQTKYSQHPKIENLYFVVIPALIKVRETRGAR